MKIRTLGWLVGLSASASSFLSCSQAKVDCVIGHAGSGVPYITQYFTPTDAPAGCSATATVTVPSLLWQLRYNASQNADPPRDACEENDDGDLVLVADPTKACETFCAADTDCNSNYCSHVTRACADNADCYSNDCIPVSCMVDDDCDTEAMNKCVLADPMDPMSGQCENEKVCGANEKVCDVGDVPAIEKLNSITGDTVGMETYHPPMTVGDEMQPNFDKGSIAILADTPLNVPAWGFVAVAAEADEADPANDKAYSLGDWKSTQPDTSNFCSAPTMSAGLQKWDPIEPDPMDPMDPGTPGFSIGYEWKNMQVYVTADIPGTQYSADLVYTQVDRATKASAMGDQTCAITYHVRGLWPSIPCWVGDPSSDPRYAGQPQEDPANPGHLIVDDSQCCADADPENGRPVGSGINPDFPTKCDDILGYCVLDAPADAKLPITGGSKLKVCQDLAAKNK
jgi:hypothetical protein